MLLVMKFGGTSLGDGARIGQAAALAHREIANGHQVVVVASAMSGVTNQLIAAAQLAARGDESLIAETRRRLFAQHIAAAQAVTPSREAQDRLIAQSDRQLTVFENLARSVHILGELTARGLDAVAALGESLCVPLVAQALRERGLAAEAIEATELIVTDDHFGNASPLMPETAAQARARLMPLVQGGTVAVVTGFMGATRGGVTTTLGRGGSDYSATILGAALDADEVWIWTDVNGVMTADPRIVPQARTLPEISYAEAAELSYFGAKVLHPKTLMPIASKNKPVRILNTFEPEHPGTRIVPQAANGGRGAVKGITAIKRLCILSLEGRGMGGVPGVAAKLFAAVARQSVSVMMIAQSSSELDICIVIEDDAAARAIAAIEQEFELERLRGDVDGVRAQRQVTIVAVVGAGLRATPGIAARVFGVLAERGINVISIAQGSSEYNLSLVVQDSDADESLRAIHQAFELEKV
ncbi:MAG: aspartate kinase [Chloroflexi bacterium]|nr:aspartate kinase [Chloroflexota bacterium]